MKNFVMNWIPSIGIGILVEIIIPERFWLVLVIITIISFATYLKIENLIERKIEDDKFHKKIQEMLVKD